METPVEIPRCREVKHLSGVETRRLSQRRHQSVPRTSQCALKPERGGQQNIDLPALDLLHGAGVQIHQFREPFLSESPRHPFPTDIGPEGHGFGILSAFWHAPLGRAKRLTTTAQRGVICATQTLAFGSIMKMKTTFPLLLATILFQAISAAIAQTPQTGGTPQASIPAIKPGNIVQLRGETPLTFQGGPFRNAGANEEFVVLSVAQDQQKLYLSSKDRAGLEIAVTAFVPSATRIVQADEGRGYAEWIKAMIGERQYGAALALFSIRDPDPRKREDANESMNRLRAAEANLAAVVVATNAPIDQKKQERDRAQMLARSNAAFNGTSAGRPRVSTAVNLSKEQAAALAVARQKQEQAAANRDMALAKFQRSIGVEPKDPTKALAGKGEADALADKEKAFAASPMMTDEFIEPPNLVAVDGPTYSETIKFINAKISENDSLGYGKGSKTMIYRPGYDSEVLVFDAAELNAEVTYTSQNHMHQGSQSVYGTDPSFVFTEHSVRLECKNRRRLIKRFWPHGVVDDISSIEIRVADKIEAKKVATAFSHLILMFGGKKEAF